MLFYFPTLLQLTPYLCAGGLLIHSNRPIVLRGPPGSGKTQLARAICLAQARTDRSLARTPATGPRERVAWRCDSPETLTNPTRPKRRSDWRAPPLDSRATGTWPPRLRVVATTINNVNINKMGSCRATTLVDVTHPPPGGPATLGQAIVSLAMLEDTTTPTSTRSAVMIEDIHIATANADYPAQSWSMQLFGIIH
ncbi:unnamed protein product [Protopolystoma xenopodis]|uniref:ATPase AAA-type core domain-containing protein n=1 Tax=Protopolystoma xenopodis TaxID=117903 RepID=A0A3S4ZQL0_9PLAT|nr:unnamed protein product [Protopolystoma xenopodis]